MLKRCLIMLTMFGLMAAISASALPQDNGSAGQQAAPQGEPPEHHGGRHFDPAKRTEMLTKQLNLTSDQQPKVLEILKSEQSQMESLHSDASVVPEDRRSKMMEIHKTSSDQIRALLDSNQQKKWDAIQSRHEQWQGHHGAEKPSGTPPDSSQ
jgi:hypothetical protein